VTVSGDRPLTVATVGDVLLAAAERSPGNEAIAFPEERRTTAGVLAGARRVARSLHALGVRRGDRVGILMPNAIEFVEAFFGAALAGGVAVLVNARYRTEELAYVVRNAEVRVLLTSDRIREQVDFAALLGAALPGLDEAEPGRLSLPSAPSLRACVLIGDRSAPGFLTERRFAALGEPVPDLDHAAAAVSVSDDGVLMYTSGTTATPKGCRLSHEAIVRTAASMARRYGIGAGDVWWCPLPLFHMSGVLPLVATFLADSRFACMTDFEPGVALRQIERERVTVHFGIFPTVNEMLMEHPDLATTDLSSVRLINVNGSPPLRARLQDAHPNALLVQAYGCTELGGIVTLTDPGLPPEELAASSGTPWPGMELRVIDPETGADVAAGERGEIVARGWGMFSGYHADPELTAAAVDDDGWFHTGDNGSLDDLGRVTFHGRLKDMLKVGGENVAALEVEAFLATHPAVALAQVVGVPDERLVEVPAAFVELRAGHEVSADELVAYCRGRIASYKIPRHVRFVSEWPLSATKVQKHVLRDGLVAELGVAE
jgi:acyl-CoA synthetase (AMP-forming)/AMP-acid ligase II